MNLFRTPVFWSYFLLAPTFLLLHDQTSALGVSTSERVGQSAPSALEAWRRLVGIKETDLISEFGKPARVTMDFGVFDSMRRRPFTKGQESEFVYYAFLTFPAGSVSNALTSAGPFGEAGHASVWLTDELVGGVDWEYPNGVRLHQRTREGPSPITRAQIEALAGRSPITITKFQGEAAKIHAEAGRYEFQLDRVKIAVIWMGPGNDVTVEIR